MLQGKPIFEVFQEPSLAGDQEELSSEEMLNTSSWDPSHSGLGKAWRAAAAHLLLVWGEVEWKGKAPVPSPDQSHCGMEKM